MFKKGDKRPEGSGRRKGQKSKNRLLRIEEYLAENKINPIQEIITLIPSLDPEDQVKTWLQLQAYLQPKASEANDPTRQDEEEEDLSSLSEAELISISAING